MPDCAKKVERIAQKIDQAWARIDSKRFEAGLDRFLPRPAKDGTPVRKRLRDAQFRQLAQFCSHSGHPQWGLRPRTFAVLRMIGIPEIIERFVEERLTDIYLPYSETNLPSFVSGRARSLFLDCQNFVLNGRAAALETCGEPHQNVSGSADDYFIYVEDLGAGGFGEVDSVIGEMSLMNFARKRIKRRHLYSDDKERLQVFENELQTLKSLSHRHLVQLVGSYTDSSCVGLIMTPVAEVNLATYLKGPQNQESRKICLRRFFGCLANALSYLHDRCVQHKDIKPANILVRQQKVYITDFGTSRSWDNDGSKTTQGTVPFITPRYCAPEVVQFGSSRNESRDIWSLGCVFLEMCSVLADHTVEEMSDFFRANGTRREYIRENGAATKAWAEKLKSTFEKPQDQQPLELALRMCTVEAEKRPLAKELVSTIFDFEGPPQYYGLCCDEQSTFGEGSNGSTLEVDDHFEEASTATLIDEDDTTLAIEAKWPPRLSYRSPTVEDPTEERTLLAFFPPGGIARTYILEDVNEPNDSNDDIIVGEESNPNIRQGFDASSPMQQDTANESFKVCKSLSFSSLDSQHRDLENDFVSLAGLLSAIHRLNRSQLPCPWPSCSAELKFQSREDLVTHVRDIHGTHELFWTPLLVGSPDVAITQKSGQWILAPSTAAPITSQPPAPQVGYGLGGDKEISASRDPFKSSLTDNVEETRGRMTDEAIERASSMPKSALEQLPHSSNNRRENPQDHKGSNTPFFLLPADRRPEPINPKQTEPEDSLQDEYIISPEPIHEPCLTSERGYFPIPKSSLVPSYFLATANDFTLKDVANSQLGAGPPPLFVYGSLMFPSILRALAARLMSAEGVYSRALQRRISTSAEDWANVSESLQQAAQQMTPALLEGHLRFRPMKSSDAALITAPSPNTGHESAEASPRGSSTRIKAMSSDTRGFVIFGLSWEAIACLDNGCRAEKPHKKSSAAARGKKRSRVGSNRSDDEYDTEDDIEGYDDTESDDDSESHRGKPYHFSLTKVEVTICTVDGKPRKILASTYMWRNPRQEVQGLRPWNINTFVRSRSLQQLSTDKKAETPYDWMAEEKLLANKMGMVYALFGDEFCQKALENDMDGLEGLYAEGCDVNAPCHYYGTPLQAAAVKGNEEMVDVMLNSMKADPNVGGGKYHYPLVAAISGGHEKIVQMLLRRGANPLAKAGSFVSPTYQAVSFEDVEMVRLLLEKGAWLSEDYQELYDVATERGNAGLCELLKEYDIRRSRPRDRITDGGRRRGNEEARRLHGKSQPFNSREEQRDLTYGVKTQALDALFEVIQLRGQKGKWTGIKAIRVLRIFFDDDVPEGTIDYLREHYAFLEKLLFNLVQSFAPPGSDVGYRNESYDGNRIKDTPTPKDNKWSSLKISSQPHPRSPKDDPAPNGRGRNDSHEEDEEDIFCLACDGRGGRIGTGRRCSGCHGSGSVVRFDVPDNPSKPRFEKCRICNGTGNLFSERDRCRVCNVER